MSNLKMSAREHTGGSSGREKEEELVRRVGGRGRSLIQAVLRVRWERVGRTPPNWLRTLNIQTPGQEVGPHGQEERRLGGFQARSIGYRTMDDGPWTNDMDTDKDEEFNGQGQDQVPPPHLGNLMIPILLWGTL